MNRTLIIATVSIVAILAAFGWVYRKGGQGALVGVERQNNDAAHQSDRARSDYDVCVDGGGVFDFGARKCRRP